MVRPNAYTRSVKAFDVQKVEVATILREFVNDNGLLLGGRNQIAICELADRLATLQALEDRI